MNEILLAVLGLVISFMTLAGLVVMAVIIIRRLPSKESEDTPSNLTRITEAQRRLARAIRSLVASSGPLDNVITRLSFAESLNIERFAATSQECALGHINRELASKAGNGVSLVLNGVRLKPSGAEITVSASRNGKKLLAEGKAVIARHGRSGRALPMLKDPRNGKFIEQMKGVPGSAKKLSKLGHLSAAVVGAAHIISGADIAKRLKLVDSKINLLLAYRRIDHMATLERIYTAAKELGSGPMSRDKCWELFRLRGELQELRFVWRREMQHHLMLIEDPKEAGWFKRKFTSQNSKDKHVHAKITEGQLQLALIEYSMRLDQAIAIGGGMVNEFETSLAGELFELESVAELLKKQAGKISGKYPDLSVKPMLTSMYSMYSMVKQYKKLLPEDTVPDTALMELEGAADADN